MNLSKFNLVGYSKSWWLILIAGIVMVLCGFAYWFWPGAGYAIASQIFGWVLILAGVIQLIVAAGPHYPKGWGWWIRKFRLVCGLYACSQHHVVRIRIPVFPCLDIHLLGYYYDYQLGKRTQG